MRTMILIGVHRRMMNPNPFFYVLLIATNHKMQTVQTKALSTPSAHSARSAPALPQLPYIIDETYVFGAWYCYLVNPIYTTSSKKLIARLVSVMKELGVSGICETVTCRTYNEIGFLVHSYADRDKYSYVRPEYGRVFIIRDVPKEIEIAVACEVLGVDGNLLRRIRGFEFALFAEREFDYFDEIDPNDSTACRHSITASA